MTKFVTILGSVFLLAGAPVVAQSGFFVFGGVIGHVHPLGTVLEGERVDVTLVMSDATADGPCPLKATIWLNEANNLEATQKRVFRRNKEVATVALERARFIGEGVLILQTQSASDVCQGYMSISIGTPGASTQGNESLRRR